MSESRIPQSREKLIQFARLMDQHGIRYWIDFGTLLGAFRERNLIPHDTDIDLCVLADQVPKVEALLERMISDGMVGRGTWKPGVVYRTGFNQMLLPIDIIVAEVVGPTLQFPFERGFDTPAFFYDELETISMGGDYLPCPRHLPRLLELRYGDDYMIPQHRCRRLDLRWDDVRGNIQKRKEKYVAFTNGVYDLFHVGHINILRRIKERFDTLIVGVHNDEQVMSYKGRKPTIPYEQRLEIIKGCKYIDQVIENADPVVTDAYLDSIGADYVVAGRERAEHLAKCYPVSDKRLHLITRTEGISSSQVRALCAHDRAAAV